MKPLQVLQTSVSDLETARRRYRVLPHGVVATLLRVSHQRLTDLIQDGVVQIDVFQGWKSVVVASALTYARGRFRRKLRGSKCPGRELGTATGSRPEYVPALK